MIHIKSFTFNPFQENSYVLFDDSKNCIIIDPGCYERYEEKELLSFIEVNGLVVKALLNTHAHIDHVLGNQFVVETFGVDFYLHSNDLTTLNSIPSYAHIYGFEAYKLSPQPNKILNNGDVLKFGEIELQVFFTPGHAPGHVVFYNKENSFVINGDVLFNGSFGRVDLPGGDIEILKNSIYSTLFSFPDETVVYCGHGPSTTIGKEKNSNYILQF
ncbi:MAG: MBL fold metallo-hydrolase [Bacteroidota bacterium]